MLPVARVKGPSASVSQRSVEEVGEVHSVAMPKLIHTSSLSFSSCIVGHKNNTFIAAVNLLCGETKRTCREIDECIFNERLLLLLLRKQQTTTNKN